MEEIEVVFTALNVDSNIRVNPVDQQYERLKCHLTPLNKDEKMYTIINKYLQSTHATTHQQYKMKIDQIFQIERDDEKEAIKDVGNRMLLW